MKFSRGHFSTLNDWLGRELALAILFFAVSFFCLRCYPQWDLWVSQQLYLGSGKFLLSDHWISNFFRKQVDWAISAVFIALSLAYLSNLIFRFMKDAVLVQKLKFISFTVLIAEVVIINGLLKSWWGRARPIQITDFGGDKIFTPAWTLADQCSRNCSFVSGHAGLAFCLMTLVVLVPPRWRAAYFLASLIFAGIVSFMRLARGAHFLSDVLFAGLIVGLTALCVHKLLNQTRPRS